MDNATISSRTVNSNTATESAKQTSKLSIKQSAGNIGFSKGSVSKTQTKEMSSRSVSEMTVDTFRRVPMTKFATKEFLIKALETSPKALVEYMNSWSSSDMQKFLDEYDRLPEAMVGKLFSEGLESEKIPDDVKYSDRFLRVACNNDKKLVISEILEKTDTCTARNALRGLSDDLLLELWAAGLPSSKLPSSIFKDESFSQKAIKHDKARWEREMSDQSDILRFSAYSALLPKMAASMPA